VDFVPTWWWAPNQGDPPSGNTVDWLSQRTTGCDWDLRFSIANFGSGGLVKRQHVVRCLKVCLRSSGHVGIGLLKRRSGVLRQPRASSHEGSWVTKGLHRRGMATPAHWFVRNGLQTSPGSL
jgi:hypothetical protein